MKDNKKKGFTLLELLIVIAIIAILSVALVIVLNPAETLKKARDAQRIADLSTLKTAIGIYTTTVNPVYLGGLSANTTCRVTPSGAYASDDRIFYSLASATDITDTTLDGGTASVPDSTQVATPALVDGTGWIPVNFDNVSGGSPISNLPVDPLNTIASTDSVSSITSSSFLYRYVCSITPLTFEIDAVLESDAYTVTDNKRLSDGGNSNSYYEIGTNLKILGASAAGVDF
ncbi:hypothetical protein A2818_01640 [Candidatus Nomurabacteria bacterium RIFCSPHIGHO2_01_FULL_40_12]|uniref:Type II secretion system protein GspG C-terminal domain-containing protein n=1 Tax=Candidatus Nomurabacteria bacterium RIFCSPHIGHO2_01_FULL_40_12 TaxID=1801737 RepID=A0A1F6V0C0_9BACT|nr:MAG: hypothetical protein A2818_01640 [Candidatus Nomurabacteria bacterium RIFCSPHIGHO2_01_FULL_40_12]